MSQGFMKLSAAFMVTAMMCQMAAGQGSDSPFAGTYIGLSTGTAQTPNGEFGETGEFSVTIKADGTVIATGTVTRNINNETPAPVGFTATGTVTDTGSASLSGTVGSGQAACPFTYSGSFSLVGPDKVGGGVYDSDCGAGVTSHGEWSCETDSDGPAQREFTWVGPTGGTYSEPTNWNPQENAPPTHDGQSGDTATFGPLADGDGNPVDSYVVTTAGATAERFIIDQISLDLFGTAQLFEPSSVEPSLTIIRGGRFNVRNGARLSGLHASVGNNVSLEGALAGLEIIGGSEASFSGRLTIGEFSRGELRVSFGGQVDAGDVVVGLGSMTVSGESSRLGSDVNLSVGSASGASEVLIEDGGLVSVVDELIMGKNGPGTVTVRGASAGQKPSSLSAKKIEVGNLDAAELVVENGAKVSESEDVGAQLTVDIGVSGPGTLKVRGEGQVDGQTLGAVVSASTVQAGGDDGDGAGPVGIGLIDIRDGGRLNAAILKLGATGGVGTLAMGETTGGSFSSAGLVIDERCNVGGFGTGRLEIGQDSTALFNGGLFIGTAEETGDLTTAVVRVAGDGGDQPSALLGCFASARLQGKAARLSIEGGGTAFFSQGLDITPTGQAKVEVNGGRSELKVQGELRVAGVNGDAELVLRQRAAVLPTSDTDRLTLVVGNAEGGSGDVSLTNVGGGGGQTTLKATNVDVLAGTISVTSGCLLTVTEAIVLGDSGESRLQLGGQDSGDELATCQTLRVGPNGTLRMCPAARLVAPIQAQFAAGATFEGSGQIACPVLDLSGVMRVGCSPGTLTIEGDYRQTQTGVLEIEVAGLEEGQFDVLKVTGTATLGGTVEVRFLDGFLPIQGDAVDFLQVGGTATGNFAQITFPQLAPGFEADLTLADGKLRLTARSDAQAGEGTSLTPPANFTTQSAIPAAPAGCGAGACGAGATPLMSLTVLALCGMRTARSLRPPRCKRIGARFPRK